MWFLSRVLVTALRLVVRSRTDVILENVALRHQLEVYRRSRRRVTVTDTGRRSWSSLARSWAGWRTAVVFVHADTVVRWDRTAWRWRWAWKSRRRGDRPHQSLGLEPPNGSRAIPADAGPIIAEPVLGGYIHVYRRAA